MTLTWRVGADVLTTLKYKILNSSKLSKDNLAVIEQGVESLVCARNMYDDIGNMLVRCLGTKMVILYEKSYDF